MPEPTVGAHLSEILNEEIGTEESGFSRRRVVRGVAWTVPVIVAAVGAPPASASPGSISATASWLSGAAPQYSKIGGGGTKYIGSAPETLSLKNTGAAAFTGTVSVNVTLSPVGSVLVGIGVESLTPATSAGAVSFAQHVSTSSFLYTGTINAGQTVNFQALYNYETINPKPSAVTYSFKMATSVVLTPTAGGASLTLTPAYAPDPSITF